ncbi:Zinc finger, C2H2 type family protein [Anopheles sinensis]|uniref:Zinc finger, C2H2 type family protein n=1 Tax=Anopheles sinensis TaxID=74873 RepID=A0A084WHH6_ANOSI|nr:Zinc finger, C2H2 type family protein [Anopheles sinensis]
MPSNTKNSLLKVSEKKGNLVHRCPHGVARSHGRWIGAKDLGSCSFCRCRCRWMRINLEHEQTDIKNPAEQAPACLVSIMMVSMMMHTALRIRDSDRRRASGEADVQWECKVSLIAGKVDVGVQN